jgi:leucyl-tRNA synthetase
MSKSRGNVVNPDEIVADYGADSLRLYEMFMGPLEAMKPWSMSGVNGVRNFLDRFWRMIVEYQEEEVHLHSAVQDVEATEVQLRTLHKTIRAVTEDIESLSLNTAIARLMEFVNFFTREEIRPKSVMEQGVLLLSPLAPHICEELWQILGHDRTLAYEPWPEFVEALSIDQTIEIPVQILGKVRGRISVARGTPDDELQAMALAEPKIAELLQGKSIRKVIVVPDRLVNIVAS